MKVVIICFHVTMCIFFLKGVPENDVYFLLSIKIHMKKKESRIFFLLYFIIFICRQLLHNFQVSNLLKNKRNKEKDFKFPASLYQWEHSLGWILHSFTYFKIKQKKSFQPLSPVNQILLFLMG